MWINLRLVLWLYPQVYRQILPYCDAHNKMDHMAVEAPGRILPPRSGRRLMFQLVVHDVQQCLSLLVHGLPSPPIPLYNFHYFFISPTALGAFGSRSRISWGFQEAPETAPCANSQETWV